MNAELSPLDVVRPLTLEGSVVRLEPIRRCGSRSLDDIFQRIPYYMKSVEDFQQLIDKALAEQEPGESVVFPTVERTAGKVIGSTRFMNTSTASIAA